MEITLEQAIRQKLMISFEGVQPPAELLETLLSQPVGGITLFRHLNIHNPAQVRALTAALQQAVRKAGQPALLIATDQEGGQLMAIGEGTTLFPGNLALGATRSTELACRAGFAMGRELAAMGINLDYAPVCDVNLNPLNPVVGTRSFGEDPAQVASLSAAMVEGLQAAGVAATAKHFPGHGDTAADSHYTVPVIPYDENRLRQVELLPFSAAVQAGVRLVMTAHIALPAFNSGKHLPATLSPAILRGLLRGELGFEGLIVSDAMDMQAIHQGAGLTIDSIAAVAAGVDLLLLNHEAENLQNVYQGLLQAVRRMLLSEEDVRASAARVLALKRWLDEAEQPPLEIVGCAEHEALALEIASRSVTLVRNSVQLLPLRLSPQTRLAVIVPIPEDLTPADTSSYISPSLAHALRHYHPIVDEFLISIDPSETQVAALRQQVNGYDLVIAGTINATQHAGQAALVNALVESGIPTVAVALRMPYDLQVYPAVSTYVCTYNILPPSMEALAQALSGRIPFEGRLPVTIPGI